MDLFYILKILWKRKWLLLIVGIGTIILTYFLLGLRSSEYKSEAVVSTGIIERRAIELERNDPFLQQFQVRSQFSNFITRLQSRTSMRRLAYALLRHDLKALKEKKEPFRTPDADSWSFDAQEAESVIQLLSDSMIYSHPSKEEEPRLRRLAKAFNYDFESLVESFNIYRDGDTDYLKIIFVSENAGLSAFSVNTLAENFTKNYNGERIAQENISVSFYINLAKEKKREVDSLSNLIGQYKRSRRIIDLKESGNSLIAARQDLELAREEERKNIEGLKKAGVSLDGYLQAEEFKFSNEDAANLLLREEVSQLKDEKGELLEQYNLRGRSDGELQKEIEEKDTELSDQIQKLVAERMEKEDRTQRSSELQNLLTRRIDVEIDLLLAEESVKSLNEALGEVEQRAVNFVTDETNLESLEGEKAIRTEEYLNIVNKMNEAHRIALSSISPLNVIEYGEVPEKPEGSKRKIIALLGGIVAGGSVALLLVFLTLFKDQQTIEKPKTNNK